MNLLETLITRFWPVAIAVTVLTVAACAVLLWLVAAITTLTHSHRFHLGKHRHHRLRRRRIRWPRLRRKARSRQYDPDRPTHLTDLILSEQNLHIERPVALSGRPDEVYRDSDGALVPVETKTRKRAAVYNSDRIQLSHYAVMLAYADHDDLPRRGLVSRKRRVAPYGYVRCVTPAGTHWRRTALLNETEVIQLAKRRVALERGKVDPRFAYKAIFCRRCQFRATCPGVTHRPL